MVLGSKGRWVFPKMVGFPPISHPKMVENPMGLLGKPTILGNPPGGVEQDPCMLYPKQTSFFDGWK